MEDKRPEEDKRSDEALILAFYAGETSAVDVIYNRYIKPLRFFLLKESWRKDDSSIDDIIQEAFLILLNTLKDKAFKPEGEGSFRAWFYTVAQNACRTYNRDQSHQPLNISKTLIETAAAKPVESEFIKKEDKKDRKKILREILSRLTPEERELMKLLGEGATYKQIKENSMFSQHPIDYLMLKVYNIRKKLTKGQK